MFAVAHLKAIRKSNPNKLEYGLGPLMTKLLLFLCTIYCFGKLFQNCPLVFLVSSHRSPSPHADNAVADLSPLTGGCSTTNTTFPSNKLLNGWCRGQRKMDQATLQNGVVWTIIALFTLYLADQTLRWSSGASFSESLTL